MIAWAQEVERYCKEVGADYDEVASFYEEIKFFPPVKYFPGVIGGHCVMPNIAILLQQFPSGLVGGYRAVEHSQTAEDLGSRRVAGDRMLIINADDWGRSRAETDAALRCYQGGQNHISQCHGFHGGFRAGRGTGKRK